jgi:hypothetical protein
MGEVGKSAAAGTVFVVPAWPASAGRRAATFVFSENDEGGLAHVMTSTISVLEQDKANRSAPAPLLVGTAGAVPLDQ